MPAATKMQRRKAQPSTRLSGKNTPLQQHNASMNIGSFARVTKAVNVAAKDIDAKPAITTAATVEVKLPASATLSSRKRKTAATSDDESSPQERASKRISSISKPAAASSSVTTKRAARSTRVTSTTAPQQSPPKPAAPQRKRGRSPSPSSASEEESAIDTGALFKRLRLEASPAPATPPLTPDASGISDSENTPDILPDEVLDLIDLHTALLKTLTLHYAHNGPNTPADLRRLCPDVARAWRRRKVTEAEVQTCIGVLATSNAKQPFVLVDYGHNKICIELEQSYSNSMFNDRELNSRFYENLFCLWRKFCSSDESLNNDGKVFFDSLPKAIITVSESFTKAAPIFAKGQQRLEDLKQGIAAKKLEKESQQQQQSTDTPMSNSDGTKMSLLDRIRQKALQKAQAPAGLTPAQLERRAALQRAVDVSALVGMLSRATANGGGGRMSFTMTAMLEKLKDTFRMGISREEGAACVRLLGKEIAPEWIRVVVVAGRENVVIDTNRTMGKIDIERRVQQLL
ncbi:uncharacterized protein B0I36DRAFT_351974 [Microdochium trichocladiopsis]|uniref:DNA replication factor Cdt1 C-terminal domain-containing protein n=1 Tax=Microdochium trichocladiopsis TaxID=1682393 RepID=A0A9P8XZL6_9PEZI|nr:uncharacterized protein B0I36DRAFT_351974 [Microdochium trichocladiopsis]KAH7026057.1 hypothetical protein B0I36DRAFT_351974 [Microdochium trichocladiopsis]